MAHYYWNEWYSGWGWFLWFGVIFLLFSGLGNWGYTYQAHRKYGEGRLRREPLDILNERYALGEVKPEEYKIIRAAIMAESRPEVRKTA